MIAIQLNVGLMKQQLLDQDNYKNILSLHNIIIPVFTNSAYNAERKIETRYWGSEYPTYKIKSITECDNFLFKPLL